MHAFRVCEPSNTKEVCMICESLTADKPEARSDTRYCSEDEYIGLAQSLCCFRMQIDSSSGQDVLAYENSTVDCAKLIHSSSEQDLVSDLASGLSLRAFRRPDRPPLCLVAASGPCRRNYHTQCCKGCTRLQLPSML